MVRSVWRGLMLGAVLSACGSPAFAQIILGDEQRPSVEVNWSVLDQLGRQPTLADMLKKDQGQGMAPLSAPVPSPMPVPVPAAKPVYKPLVVEKPLAPAAKPAAKPKLAEVKPQVAKPQMSKSQAAKSKPIPASPVVAAVQPKPDPKGPSVADLVQTANKPAAPVIPAMPEPAKAQLPPASVKPVGPQIALPETPKTPEAPKLPEAAKMDPAKVEAPKQIAALAPVQAKPPAADAVKPAEPGPTPPALALTPPPAAPKVEAVKPPVEAAVASAAKGDTLAVAFTSDSTRVPDASRAELERLAKRMERDESLGLQLIAFAEGDEANASKARRLSLTRALEVRKILMENGVRSTRIEVRALGNKVEGKGPADRVDAVLVGR